MAKTVEVKLPSGEPGKGENEKTLAEKALEAETALMREQAVLYAEESRRRWLLASNASTHGDVASFVLMSGPRLK